MDFFTLVKRQRLIENEISYHDNMIQELEQEKRNSENSERLSIHRSLKEILQLNLTRVFTPKPVHTSFFPNNKKRLTTRLWKSLMRKKH